MDIDSPPHPPPTNTNIEEVSPTPTSDLRTVPPIETEEDVKMDATVDVPGQAEYESTPPKTSLRFKNPNLSLEMNGDGSAGPSRASTPNGSVTASGGGRASRRKSAMRNGPASGLAPTIDAGPSGALSIFAPPSSAEVPEALQGVISPSRIQSVEMNGHSDRNGNGNGNGNGNISAGPSTSSRELRVRLTIPNPAEGEATNEGSASTRLRPTRGRESMQRVGVSASGKGVKLGGSSRATGPPIANSAARKKGVQTPEMLNQDFCSICRGIGSFLCCDGCPRSFHFMCLEPPLRVDELPKEDQWFCRKCKVERATERKRNRGPSPVPNDKDKDIKPIPAIFKQLTKEMLSENPEQFRLPENVRTFFTGVGTGDDGKYLEADESRKQYDRKGFQEDRDSHRLKDRSSRPVTCYACAGSSIPLRSLTTDPGSSWRPIVSCDYCSLSWHLDCLNPPLAVTPNSGKKWMCPNHAEQVMKKRRTIREKLEVVDVSSAGEANNGNITVVPDEPVRPVMEYEDLIINRKKFRVPEKIIKLDFWSKLGFAGNKRKRAASESSELTSIAESTGDPPERPFDRTANREDLEAANLVLSWWNTDNTPTVARHPPPLHTDPVLPNQITSMTDPTPSRPGPSAEGPVPTTLASVDEWEVTTPVEAGISGAASVAGSSGSGEARRITLKVNRSG